MSENENLSVMPPEDANTKRAEWRRPQLRKFDAREAQLTPTSNTDNAVLS